MTFPNNEKIIRFVKEYGYSVLLSFVVLVFAKHFIISTYRNAVYADKITCSLNDFGDRENTFIFRGKVFEVEDSEYNEYSGIGDRLYIRFSEKQ